MASRWQEARPVAARGSTVWGLFGGRNRVGGDLQSEHPKELMSPRMACQSSRRMPSKTGVYTRMEMRDLGLRLVEQKNRMTGRLVYILEKAVFLV